MGSLMRKLKARFRAEYRGLAARLEELQRYQRLRQRRAPDAGLLRRHWLRRPMMVADSRSGGDCAQRQLRAMCRRKPVPQFRLRAEVADRLLR